MSLQNIPPGMLVDVVLPSLPIKELYNLCQTNRTINKLCNEESIWFKRIKLEFPAAGDLPAGRTWREFYTDTLQWYDKTLDHFGDVGDKPKNLLWSQYYKSLLYQNSPNKRIIIIDNNNYYSQEIKIIPGTTTLRSLFNDIFRILDTIDPNLTISNVIITDKVTLNANGLQIMGPNFQFMPSGPDIYLTIVSNVIYASDTLKNINQSSPWTDSTKNIVIVTTPKISPSDVFRYARFPISAAATLMTNNLIPASLLLYNTVGTLRNVLNWDNAIGANIKQWLKSNRLTHYEINQPLLPAK